MGHANKSSQQFSFTAYVHGPIVCLFLGGFFCNNVCVMFGNWEGAFSRMGKYV